MVNRNEQQEKVLKLWKEQKSNVLVNSGAGSGKTTTLLDMVSCFNKRSLIIAFNKSIQTEIEEKLIQRGLSQGKALTLHSLGLNACRNKIRSLKIDTHKNWKIIDKLKEIYPNDLKKVKRKEVFPLFYTLMEMNDVSRMFFSEDFEEILTQMNNIGKSYLNIPKLEDFWEKFKELRNLSYEINRPIIDFIDMIFLPVKYNLKIPINPEYLYIDEAQDLNLIQHLFIKKLISQGDVKKWAALGDSRQSIYAFAGSLPNSFEKFKSYENVVEKNLDVCFRCAKNIIFHANKVYGNLVPFKEEEGIVANETKAENIKDGAMVLCRNSAPLLELYFELLYLKKPCYIYGDEILTQIKGFLSPFKYDTIGIAKIKLEEIHEELILDQTENGKIKLRIFLRNYENFSIFATRFSENLKIYNLLKEIENLFSENKKGIMLTTIHKSKGLESDVVYILKEDLIPSKFAVTETQLIQEKNLLYVARTRAKKEMYYLNI